MNLHQITKNLKNPRRGAYMVGYVTQKALPVPLAKLLALGNRPAMRGVVDLPTCDGSGQACHPSIAVFRGRTYLACTPYPYGVEYYENPCLYVREKASARWRPVPGLFPQVRPQRLGFEHYSDPCLFRRGETLILLFRKCERRPDGKVELLYTSSTEDGETWTAPRLLAQGGEDSLICPAVAGEALFCVERNEKGARIVRYALDALDGLRERTVCDVDGLEQNIFVWHMECATQPDGTVRGLFMLQKKSASTLQSKLALFRWEPERTLWRLERELPPTEEERNAVAFVYKSCFTENPGVILCSACDRKDRWFLYEKAI